MQQESAVKSAADADRLAAIAAVQHPRAAAPDRRSKQPLQTAADAECICTCSEGADRRTVFFGQTQADAPRDKLAPLSMTKSPARGTDSQRRHVISSTLPG